ncbi:hypothetical protein [Microbispora sp. CA-102843]|uniref:hypothetical protein n=1 Tax=Microbispora sp. CA-102843 TaxID=3239952 RepID=UPI003D94BBC9
MSGEDGRQQPPAQSSAGCVSWCELKDEPHPVCTRVFLRGDGPSRPVVVMIAEPDRPWPLVAVTGRDQIWVLLDLPTAQGVATMLAYLAPSTRTAAVAQALQRAASVGFPPLGYPEYGPVEGAHNPWKAGERLGELLDGDPPAGA